MDTDTISITDRTEENPMKKACSILLCLILVFSFSGSVCAEGTDDSLMWSEPGLKYIAAALAPQKEIHDEKEAEAYADSLWPLLSDDPLPDGNREMAVDHHDNSYHYGIYTTDGIALYNVGFLSNGVIMHIGCRVNDPRRYADDARKDPSELDPKVWEQAKVKITEWVEKVSPGVLALLQPMDVYSVIDVGDRQYLFIAAMPLDAEYDGCLSLIAIVEADGSVRIMDYSLYGAG